MNRAVPKLFEIQLGKDSFEFNLSTKVTEPKPQF